MPDLDRDEEKRLYDRLDELGLKSVNLIAANDGFPATWRRHVHEWIARDGKRPEEPKDGDDQGRAET